MRELEKALIFNHMSAFLKRYVNDKNYEQKTKREAILDLMNELEEYLMGNLHESGTSGTSEEKPPKNYLPN